MEVALAATQMINLAPAFATSAITGTYTLYRTSLSLGIILIPTSILYYNGKYLLTQIFKAQFMRAIRGVECNAKIFHYALLMKTTNDAFIINNYGPSDYPRGAINYVAMRDDDYKELIQLFLATYMEDYNLPGAETPFATVSSNILSAVMSDFTADLVDFKDEFKLQYYAGYRGIPPSDYDTYTTATFLSIRSVSYLLEEWGFFNYDELVVSIIGDKVTTKVIASNMMYNFYIFYLLINVLQNGGGKTSLDLLRIIDTINEEKFVLPNYENNAFKYVIGFIVDPDTLTIHVKPRLKRDPDDVQSAVLSKILYNNYINMWAYDSSYFIKYTTIVPNLPLQNIFFLKRVLVPAIIDLTHNVTLTSNRESLGYSNTSFELAKKNFADFVVKFERIYREQIASNGGGTIAKIFLKIAQSSRMSGNATQTYQEVLEEISNQDFENIKFDNIPITQDEREEIEKETLYDKAKDKVSKSAYDLFDYYWNNTPIGQSAKIALTLYSISTVAYYILPLIRARGGDKNKDND